MILRVIRNELEYELSLPQDYEEPEFIDVLSDLISPHHRYRMILIAKIVALLCKTDVRFRSRLSCKSILKHLLPVVL